MSARGKIVFGVLSGLIASGIPVNSQAASVSSDSPAALLVAPKVIYIGTTGTYGEATDSTIQVTNTSATDQRAVHCFYVDATRHCEIGGEACHRTSDCATVGDFCAAPAWDAHNFSIVLSPNQTLGWNLSTGVDVPAPGAGSIPVAPSDPFLGELKCLEVTDNSLSAVALNSNDLIGNVTIVKPAGQGSLDAEAYNAIGIQAAVSDESSQNDLTLCLGGTPGSTECPVPGAGQTSEYAACPGSLWMNHYFDGIQSGSGERLATTLTLVPCSENFEETSAQQSTTVQFLTYNEFEQRFSAKTTVDCYAELPLVNIDSKVTGTNSIFSIGVQGTVGGQTLIRPVLGGETAYGHGLLGIAEQRLTLVGAAGATSAAFNLNFSGVTKQGDIVRFTLQ